jgi:hypothetical protein
MIDSMRKSLLTFILAIEPGQSFQRLAFFLTLSARRSNQSFATERTLPIAEFQLQVCRKTSTPE